MCPHYSAGATLHSGRSAHAMRSAFLSLLLFFATILTTTTTVDGALIHKDVPEVIFSTSSLSSTVQGNSIQPSPDGSLIFVTSADGALTALDSQSGQVRFTIQPRPREDGWSTECNSGISIYHDKENASGSVSDYLVYAVIDIPPSNSQEKVSSRIFAVDVEDTNDGVLRWVTKPIPGRIAGTPAIDSSGLYVYTVHNDIMDGSGDTVGHFSIATDADDGELLFTAQSPTYEDGNDDAFSPLGIAHNPMQGNYDGGEGNTNDLLVWGADSPQGSGSRHNFAFQLPANFRKGSRNTRIFGIIPLQGVNWPTSTAPALSNDGERLYFVSSSQSAHGWASTSFDSDPTWETKINVLGSVPPVLSEDGTTLFLATNSAIQALDSSTGSMEWRDRGIGSQVLSRPAVSQDSTRVFFAESLGMVYSSDVASGRQYWTLEVDGNVVADLALSMDGTTLYVVTSDGGVSGIRVAEDDGRPTPRPTMRPTLMEPTSSKPTPLPSKRPSPNTPPTAAPVAKPTPAPKTRPTLAPQVRPTRSPSERAPVRPPSGNNGGRPTYEPTWEPTMETQPSPVPTATPTSPVQEALPPSGGVLLRARVNMGIFVAVSAFLLH